MEKYFVYDIKRPLTPVSSLTSPMAAAHISSLYMVKITYRNLQHAQGNNKLEVESESLLAIYLIHDSNRDIPDTCSSKSATLFLYYKHLQTPTDQAQLN